MCSGTYPGPTLTVSGPKLRSSSSLQKTASSFNSFISIHGTTVPPVIWSQNSRMSFAASHLPLPTLKKKLCSADCTPSGVFFCLCCCLHWPRLPGRQLLHTLLQGHLAEARSHCTQIFSGFLWPRELSRDGGGRKIHRRIATEAGALILPSPDGS